MFGAKTEDVFVYPCSCRYLVRATTTLRAQSKHTGANSIIAKTFFQDFIVK